MSAVVIALTYCTFLAAEPTFPFLRWLEQKPSPTMIAYTPLELDPRNPANQARLSTESIKADLQALRPAFNGLILYGYNEATTPRIVDWAHTLGYEAILFGIWDIRVHGEVTGISQLIADYRDTKMTFAVLVGNEGITFNRYNEADLEVAGRLARRRLPASVPIATSEPLAAYERVMVRNFGDFLAPNIHPVFDRPQLDTKAAATWAREQTIRLASETKRPVLLKETGFPHGGKNPYSPDTQRAFWSAYTEPGLLEKTPTGGWAYFGIAFEAFDLPWKREASGLAIEDSWGLLNTERKPYPAFDVWKALRRP